MFRLILIMVLGGLCAPLWAEQAVPALTVSEAYVRGMPPTQKVTAAFMTLKNTRSSDVNLVSAYSDAAQTLEFHQHIHNNGMMRMVKQSSIRIPANGELELKPGNYHLMMIGLKRPLKEGESVLLTLVADDGEEIQITAPVISVLHKHH
ncbi:copper chaperone PCu(A)C [Spongiibacter sp. KMU-158]|uniref:Copper chaperone PCu(A)C n=1 Tax=Spongiibacter pelagi TaxID=2760804 RepID=A0A927GW11_9GAMM|nr:copper chaperone PCu(A)C [Spongiibacter pelagi]MBD2858648.1 copper chaperone PCu(A)C [Spongiibacter pelagi]